MKRLCILAIAAALSSACALPGDEPAAAPKSGAYTSDETAEVGVQTGLIRYTVDDGPLTSTRAFAFAPQNGGAVPVKGVLSEISRTDYSPTINVTFQHLSVGASTCEAADVAVERQEWIPDGSGGGTAGAAIPAQSCSVTIDSVELTSTETRAYGHFTADFPSHVVGSFFLRVQSQ